MAIVERVPVGEVINGIRIIKRVERKHADSVKMYECECLCGRTMFYTSHNIIEAALTPCKACLSQRRQKQDIMNNE